VNTKVICANVRQNKPKYTKQNRNAIRVPTGHGRASSSVATRCVSRRLQVIPLRVGNVFIAIVVDSSATLRSDSTLDGC
jgi:hypothetical protein